MLKIFSGNSNVSILFIIMTELPGRRDKQHTCRFGESGIGHTSGGKGRAEFLVGLGQLGTDSGILGSHEARPWLAPSYNILNI